MVLNTRVSKTLLVGTWPLTSDCYAAATWTDQSAAMPSWDWIICQPSKGGPSTHKGSSRAELENIILDMKNQTNCKIMQSSVCELSWVHATKPL